MENPVNAAYGRGEVPKTDPRAITLLGVRIPGQQVWMVMAGLFAILVLLCVIVVVQLPSGIPFLAAKNANSFLGYVGYFFAYMFGFFLVLVVFFALLAAIGTVARDQIPLLQ
jgi:CDP-diglyceride synthetase